jgi:ParB/RepB/Spo0J family partition protein
MTTSVNGGRQRIALDRIAIPGNVRELDADPVDALAMSIRLRGLLVPVIVRPLGEEFELVAGFHRFAAHKQLGEKYIDVDVRAGDDEHGDRAIENIARKQLDAHEEARAVQAMLADGLTDHGAAQALGWPKARVTARVKLLELPERARELVGAGVVALSAVDQLRAIGKMSPPLLEALIDYLCDGNESAAERLGREPGWVLDSALRETGTKVFVARLDVIDDYDIAELKLEQERARLTVRSAGSGSDAEPGGSLDTQPRRAMVGGSASCAPAATYRARPALACIIGARRAWTAEMISSEEIPCR